MPLPAAESGTSREPTDFRARARTEWVTRAVRDVIRTFDQIAAVGQPDSGPRVTDLRLVGVDPQACADAHLRINLHSPVRGGTMAQCSGSGQRALWNWFSSASA